MSHAYSYHYFSEEINRIRAERRAARFRESVNSFLVCYQSKCDELIRNGYEQYIPNEINRLVDDLNEARALLQNNTAEAKNISLRIGSYINGLSRLAENAKYQVSQNRIAEALAKKESDNALINEFSNILRKYNNPVTISFAQDELVKLRQTIVDGSFSNSSANSLDLLNKRISEILSEASVKAEKWKEEKEKENKKSVVLEQIEETKELISQKKIQDQEKANELFEKLKKLKNDTMSGNISVEINNELDNINESADEALINEETRNEYVKRIVKQLRSQGFTVQPATIDKKTNIVKVLATKPSGARAEARIGLDSRLKYKFDNYVGDTCVKDIKKFNVDLKKIYGIKLDDEKHLWQNPMRIEKDAIDIQNTRSNSL